MIKHERGIPKSRFDRGPHCECWVYGSDIPHGDRLCGAVDVFLQRKDISEESKRKLLVDSTARFYGL